MQTFHPFVVAGLLASAATCQVNAFLRYPQDPERQTVTCTSSVGRPDSNRAGEALVEIDATDYRGVGDPGGFLQMYGIFHWLADERLSTVETYDLVMRGAAPNGPGPDMSLDWLQITGLTTPPSTNPGRGTWVMRDGFGASASPGTGSMLLPRFYFGIRLHANPQWPATDGHGLFRADLDTAGSGALVGENHRAGATNPTWTARPALPPFSTPWSYLIGLLVTSPNLNVGGIDPTSTRLGVSGANLGMNGLWPDISGNPRSDGLIVRVTDNYAPFALVGLGASLGLQPQTRVDTPRILGWSYILSPQSAPLDLGLGVLVNGVREFPVALPGTIPTSLLGTDVAFQGVVWEPNLPNIAWTNAQVSHL